MSSWRYAFLFPHFPGRLCPAKAVTHLTEFGAEFDGSIRKCVAIDDEGHLLDVGESVALGEPIVRDLIGRLENGTSFSIQLRSVDFVVSVEFLLESPNPHISIGWPRKLLDESPPRVQSDFWRSIRAFAKDSQAGYVVIVDDASDHFEDRFVDVGGKRILDLHVNHCYGLGIREIWLQSSITSTLPEGVTYGDSEQIGDGFERHLVAV